MQTRFRGNPWVAPIAGAVVLSVTVVCLATGSSKPAEQVPAAAQQPTVLPRWEPPLAATPGPPTTPPPPPAPPAPAPINNTLPPAPRGAPAAFGTGVSAQITAVEPIEAVATAPGDIAGPALAISVRLTNGSAEAIDADNVTVTASDATGAPASPVTGDQAHPFGGSIAAGASQDAIYPFRIPAGAATGALIVISYRAGVPIATLTI